MSLRLVGADLDFVVVLSFVFIVLVREQYSVSTKKCLLAERVSVMRLYGLCCDFPLKKVIYRIKVF